MTTGKKVILTLVIGTVLIGGYFLLRPKDTVEKKDIKNNEDDKNSQSSNTVGVIKEPKELVIEDPKPPEHKVNHVYTTCSAKVYKVIFDDKKVASLGAVISEAKANSKLGEFVKNVFINSSYPYVIVRTSNGNEVIVNKTYTRIGE